MSIIKKTNNKNKKLAITGSVVLIAIVAIIFFLSADNGRVINKGADVPSSGGVVIEKSDITQKATFYPYMAGNTYMEVIAIKASDGTIRTALNTCQICTGSGRAYYEQEGDVLVCQNCKNRFTVDQVEIIKGGCNPVPISSDFKVDNGDTITVSDVFMNNNTALFYNWKN